MDLNQLKHQILQIIETPDTSRDQKLTLLCQFLHNEVDYYDWVGFYFAVHPSRQLQLGPFAGEPTDHTIIPFGKGICGQVAVSGKNFVVPDVQAQDNYIACSIHVKSEIVVPLYVQDINIGQLDIDSHTLNAFTEKDEQFLEWVNQQVAQLF
jgi:L-methionine (R)-S-oxide reductase